MKNRYSIKRCMTSVLGIIAAVFVTMPMMAFAAETGKPASDSTDLKIIDSMPIIYSNSNLNAALSVMDMSTGSPVDLNNTTVTSGKVLTYIIAYRNDNAQTETVHMQIPVPSVFPLRSISNQGTYAGTFAEWSNIEVKSGETVTRYITCDTPSSAAMTPNTGLVMISNKDNMQTNTVSVAVGEEQKPVAVLGVARRMLKAAETSPAVLGMRRAIQTGDTSYIAVRLAFLGAACVAVVSLIVLLFSRRRKTDKK